jgi:hypothetical protein
MNDFVSLAAPIGAMLDGIIACDSTHAKFLNTLSYLENCGARKIAACEHPTLVKEEVLKHAAEEFRHAHHLKKQLSRIGHSLANYSPCSLLGGAASLNYLKLLDLKTCRYLKGLGLTLSAIKEMAYLLVTYAIELRASELYALYDARLKNAKSKVVVSSILLEEKDHLQEMIHGIDAIPQGWTWASFACQQEGILCHNWLKALSHEI